VSLLQHRIGDALFDKELPHNHAHKHTHQLEPPYRALLPLQAAALD
jgi:hypothetical protein